MGDQNPEHLKIKGQQKAAWDDSAAGWKRWWLTFERAAQSVNDRLVELAEVRAGNRVLDIATGSGEPALTAARAIGQSGRVVAVDMSPGMLAIAHERIDAAGLTNIDLVESDAESLSLDAHSFDAVLCRWGLMFMPDLDGVLREMHRALKPGG
ncbi:MAG TPA: methyltransferase domain-containing protein, partial [Candidatus Binatus sp.]|nr:methyltransferase domain-containing protein [Candidatus Binatus sp.]